MDQLSMFDLFKPGAPPRPALELVSSDKVHSVLRITNPRRKSQELARIELHPHREKWMWGISYRIAGREPQGYPVGAKWGRFAPTVEDALQEAVDELRVAIDGYRKSKSKTAVLDWLMTLEPVAV
jgi:hypothetical protein